MFELKLYDRNGTELKLGDIVKISDGRSFNFYAEVKYLESEQLITPFHTFSFNSFVKEDKLPDNAVRSTEERYGIWWVPGEAETDKDADQFRDYLMDWRKCESHLEKRMWRIKKVDQNSTH